MLYPRNPQLLYIYIFIIQTWSTDLLDVCGGAFHKPLLKRVVGLQSN